MYKKFHKRDKHMGYPTNKILGTILKVEWGRTPPNVPENKKTDHNL